MNVYVPEKHVTNLLWILEMFVDTHESSDASAEDVKVARTLVYKIQKKRNV